jgi:hypothetical protein
MKDDFGYEVQVGDHVLVHCLYRGGGNEMMVTKIVAFHGKKSIEVPVKMWYDFMIDKPHWDNGKNLTFQRFIKVDPEWAEARWDHVPEGFSRT